MEKKKLPKSIRKYIRKEKARIRREFSDSEKQKELINELYKKLHPKSAKSLVSLGTLSESAHPNDSEHSDKFVD